MIKKIVISIAITFLWLIIVTFASMHFLSSLYFKIAEENGDYLFVSILYGSIISLISVPFSIIIYSLYKEPF